MIPQALQEMRAVDWIAAIAVALLCAICLLVGLDIGLTWSPPCPLR